MRKIGFIGFVVITLLCSANSFSQELNTESSEDVRTWNLDQCISYALDNNISVSQSYLKQRTAEL